MLLVRFAYFLKKVSFEIDLANFTYKTNGKLTMGLKTFFDSPMKKNRTVSILILL